MLKPMAIEQEKIGFKPPLPRNPLFPASTKLTNVFFSIFTAKRSACSTIYFPYIKKLPINAKVFTDKLSNDFDIA